MDTIFKISGATPMEVQQELIICEVSQFSNSSMFGHLFDMRGRLESGINVIEHKCSAILGHQLRYALNPAAETDPLQIVRLTSELEQSLTVVFSPHSPFWERYYQRQQDNSFRSADGVKNPLNSSDEIKKMARYGLPAFFTSLDALYYASGQHAAAYPLLLSSTEEYLSSCLHSIACPQSTPEGWSKALRLVGPLNVPKYRLLLENKMNNHEA